MQPNIYETSASLYDVGHDRKTVNQDLAFYKKQIPPSAHVLEIGCGTGRVALALAEHGCRVAGIDLSEHMLDIFRGKLEKRPEIQSKITLHQEDMTNFDLNQTFDWIIFPFRSFQALTADDARDKCLAAVKAHMNGDSRAVLTLFNPSQEILDNWGRKKIFDFETRIPETGQIMKCYHDEESLSKENQVMCVRMIFEIFEGDQLIKEVFDYIEIGYLFQDQCREMIKRNGFIIESFFENYTEDPNAHGEQIFVITKE